MSATFIETGASNKDDYFIRGEFCQGGNLQKRYCNLVSLLSARNTTTFNIAVKLCDESDLAEIKSIVTGIQSALIGSKRVSLNRRAANIAWHENGSAVLSNTMLNGKYALRVANVNHRSRQADFDILIRDVIRIGQGLEAEKPGSAPQSG